MHQPPGPLPLLGRPAVSLGGASRGLAASHAASFPAAALARPGRGLEPPGPPSSSQAEAPAPRWGTQGVATLSQQLPRSQEGTVYLITSLKRWRLQGLPGKRQG